MTKPIDEMSADELLAAREEIARERAALGMTSATKGELSDAGYAVPAENDPVEELRKLATVPDVEIGEKWPHQFMEHAGMTLEVRKPGEAALVAISLTGSPALTPEVQMRIFSKFLENHLSPKSFSEVIEAMLNPDSEISLQSMIKALAEMKA